MRVWLYFAALLLVFAESEAITLSRRIVNVPSEGIDRLSDVIGRAITDGSLKTTLFDDVITRVDHVHGALRGIGRNSCLNGNLFESDTTFSLTRLLAEHSIRTPFHSAATSAITVTGRLQLTEHFDNGEVKSEMGIVIALERGDDAVQGFSAVLKSSPLIFDHQLRTIEPSRAHVYVCVETNADRDLITNVFLGYHAENENSHTSINARQISGVPLDLEQDDIASSVLSQLTAPFTSTDNNTSETSATTSTANKSNDTQNGNGNDNEMKGNEGDRDDAENGEGDDDNAVVEKRRKEIEKRIERCEKHPESADCVQANMLQHYNNVSSESHPSPRLHARPYRYNAHNAKSHTTADEKTNDIGDDHKEVHTHENVPSSTGEHNSKAKKHSRTSKKSDTANHSHNEKSPIDSSKSIDSEGYPILNVLSSAQHAWDVATESVSSSVFGADRSEQPKSGSSGMRNHKKMQKKKKAVLNKAKESESEQNVLEGHEDKQAPAQRLWRTHLKHVHHRRNSSKQ